MKTAQSVDASVFIGIVFEPSQAVKGDGKFCVLTVFVLQMDLIIAVLEILKSLSPLQVELLIGLGDVFVSGTVCDSDRNRIAEAGVD